MDAKQSAIISQFTDIGVSVSEDWAGCLMADGEPPEVCPIHHVRLADDERLDSGDGGIELLKTCPVCGVTWDTGKYKK